MMLDQNRLQDPRSRRRPALAIALLIAVVPPALPAPGFAGDASGLIYGKVTTRGATYQGRLRWNEEASWGDHFNASKEERPHADDLPRSRPEARESIRVFGVTLGLRRGELASRSFIARFGDIRKIEVQHRSDVLLTMKSGTEIKVDGSGTNDIGDEITVWDDAMGKIEVDWDRIETIELMAAPAGLTVDVERLHGTLKSSAGTFTGFIQWDKDECLSTDKLDGETDDGKVSIEMGRIKSIERRSRSSSRVTLRDGREMVLDGTNDVDSDNRGIFVDDERYGRVLVGWDAFDRVDFSAPGSAGSGPSYDDFEAGGPIRGTVTDRDGKKHSGRLVYDIDESETWEVLNGERRDVEYNVPFALIKSIVADGHSAVRVTLRDGEEVTLEDTADTGDGNAGVLVLGDGEPVYVEWEDVDRIDLDS